MEPTEIVPSDRDLDSAPVATAERTGRWAAAAADPQHAAELLALAAVASIGPRARTWARSMRAAHPSADADELAALAVRRCVRLAGFGGAAAATAGLFAPIAGVAVQSWTDAELVLHLAAVYGQDPVDEARAADLLVLTGVYPGRREATAALTAATADSAGTGGGTRTGGGRRPAGDVWRLGAPMAVQVGSWVAARTLARGIPGVALLFAALGGRAAANRLAARAVAYYGDEADR